MSVPPENEWEEAAPMEPLEPLEPPVGVEAEAIEAAPLPPAEFARKALWYSLANLGYGMFFALNNATLTLFLKNMGAGGVLIGLMGSSHSIEGAVIQPLVGTASDRLRTRWGRRRPFMLLFTPLSALFLLLTPAASHLPVSIRLAAVVTTIFLFTICFNVAQDPYMALMPDIMPKPQRGRVTGIWSFIGVIGQATLVLIPPTIVPIPMKFVLVAIVMLITTLLTCLAVREPELPPEPHKIGPFDQIKIALNGLNTLRQARKSLLTLFFSGRGNRSRAAVSDRFRDQNHALLRPSSGNDVSGADDFDCCRRLAVRVAVRPYRPEARSDDRPGIDCDCGLERALGDDAAASGRGAGACRSGQRGAVRLGVSPADAPRAPRRSGFLYRPAIYRAFHSAACYSGYHRYAGR